MTSVKSPLGSIRSSAVSITFALLTLGTIANSGHAQTLVNGNFEEPVITEETFASNPAITGWTNRVGRGEVIIVNGNGAFGAVCGPQDGKQWLYLSGGRGRAYVQQEITGLKVGTAYELQGYYAYPGRPGSNPGQFKITLVDGPDILAPTTATAATAWVKFNAPFIATAEKQILRIITMGDYPGVQVGIDNLSLTPKQQEEAPAPVAPAAPAAEQPAK